MSYLVSRGQTGSQALKTTSLGQVKRTSSYYTNHCDIRNAITQVDTVMQSTTSTFATGGHARTSADGTPITVSRNVSTGSVSQYPDGAANHSVGITSGFQVVRSHMEPGPVSITTSAAKYSGPQYCNPIYGDRKLVMRTGTGKDDVVKYGLTTNTNAKEYCGLRMRIDGNVAYIGRVDEQTLGFEQSKNQVYTRTTGIATMTSTVSSLSSSSTYTSSGYTDHYSYSYSSYTDWSYYDANHRSTSETYSSSATGTSSWVEYRTSGLTNDVSTSKLVGITWTHTSTSSVASYSSIYANSTYTSKSTCHTDGFLTKYSKSGNRSSRVGNPVMSADNNHLDGMISNLGTAVGKSFYFPYSIYETYSKSGRSETRYSTYGNSGTSITNRSTTSFKTYNSSTTMTYIGSCPHANVTMSASSGSYTTTSFNACTTCYYRQTSLQSLINGAINQAFTSTGCRGSVVGSTTTNSFVTNAYQITSTTKTIQSQTSNVGYSGVSYKSSDGCNMTVSAPVCDKTTSYSSTLAIVSAGEPVFTIKQSGCYISKLSDNFIDRSIYGVNQTFMVSTTKVIQVPNAGESGTFSTSRYDRAYTYTVNNTARVSSVVKSVSAGTYIYSSTNGLRYTVSVPSGYITVLQSGYTCTDKMKTYTTSSTWTYSSSTYVMNGSVVAGGGLVRTTLTGYGCVSATYTRTSSASITLTDYLSGSKLLSHITTSTRTSTYSTSMHTTASNTTLVSSAYNSVSWWQRTSSSYTTLITSSRASGSSKYTYTSTYGTNTTTCPATISKSMSELVHSYSGTSNTTLTSTANMSGTFSFTNGYTMSASVRTISNTTSRTTYSTYPTQSIRFTTSYTDTLFISRTSTSGTSVRTDIHGHAFTFSRRIGAFTSSVSGGVAALIHSTSTGFNVRASVDPNGSYYTTSTRCYTTYTHILDGINKTGKYIFPSDVVAGVTVTSSNYSTYAINNVESVKTSSTTRASIYASVYANNITNSTCQTYSRTASQVGYYTTSKRFCGTAKVAEYSSGSRITSYVTLENIYSNTSSSLRKTSTWKKEFFSQSTHFSMRGYTTNSIGTGVTSSLATSSSTCTYYRTGNYMSDALYTSSSYGNCNFTSNHFTILTSSTISSRTSRTTLASYLESASTWARTLSAGSYVSSYNRSRSSSYYYTYTGYEYSSYRTTNLTANKPYVLTSQSAVSYGENFGMSSLSSVSYMSLQFPESNGHICTYSYHTNSYYSSRSTLATRTTPIHGFIYDSSSTTMKSNSSATTYEAHYTGSEVYLLPKDTAQKASLSYTSTTEFTSFTQLVGNIAASLGVLMTYSKATMSKSYLKYMTSSMTMTRRFTSHNYNM